MKKYEEIKRYIKDNYKDIYHWLSYEGKNEDMPSEIISQDLTNILFHSNTQSFFEIDKNEYPEWNGHGAAPYRICTYLFIHPDLKENIEKINIFIPILQYPSQDKILENEIGILNNFRVIVEELPSFEFETAIGNKGYTSYVVITRTDKDDIYCVALKSSKEK